MLTKRVAAKSEINPGMPDNTLEVVYPVHNSTIQSIRTETNIIGHGLSNHKGMGTTKEIIALGVWFLWSGQHEQN